MFSKRGNAAWEAADSPLQLVGQYHTGFISFICVLSANRRYDEVHPELPSPEFSGPAELRRLSCAERAAVPDSGSWQLRLGRSAG